MDTIQAGACGSLLARSCRERVVAGLAPLAGCCGDAGGSPEWRRALTCWTSEASDILLGNYAYYGIHFQVILIPQIVAATNK
jgi:hypothetical protein